MQSANLMAASSVKLGTSEEILADVQIGTACGWLSKYQDLEPCDETLKRLKTAEKVMGRVERLQNGENSFRIVNVVLAARVIKTALRSELS